MKNLVSAIVLMFSLNYAFAGEELKVGVKGMVCAFCAQGIEKKFSAQPEVEKVEVSLANKILKLKLKDGKSLSKEKIAELLKDSGYEVNFEVPQK
jgi:periplasmic mercuric ion binding protein